MQTARRKKIIPVETDDNAVDVRISPRAPRAKISTPPTARAQSLATALLETMIGQIADYVENSRAVEKLIRAQTTQVLRELASDPRLSALIRSQAEQYVAELIAHPEILEPLVRVQVDRYLANHTKPRGKAPEHEKMVKPKPSRGKSRKRQISLEE